MAISKQQFSEQYRSASLELGVPMVDERTIEEEYAVYIYGDSLLIGENFLTFSKDKYGRLTWDVGPAL